MSRLRPFARRAFSTCLPAFVAIRARKPWVRLRFKLLGWNVLFMVIVDSFKSALSGEPFRRGRVLVGARFYELTFNLSIK